MGSKYTVFALFYFLFEGNFPSTSPRGGLYLEGRFNGGFLRYHAIHAIRIYCSGKSQECSAYSSGWNNYKKFTSTKTRREKNSQRPCQRMTSKLSSENPEVHRAKSSAQIVSNKILPMTPQASSWID